MHIHIYIYICRVVYLQVCKRGYGPIPAQVRYGSVASVGPWGPLRVRCGVRGVSPGGLCGFMGSVGPFGCDWTWAKGISYTTCAEGCAVCCCSMLLLQIISSRYAHTVLVCKDICKCNGNHRIDTHIQSYTYTHTITHTLFIYIIIYILWVYLVVHAVTAVAGGVYIGCIYRNVYAVQLLSSWSSPWHTILA